MLQKITITKCPVCGNSKVEEEGRKSKHTNGHWNEYREFSCGYKVKFSPNFMKEAETDKCRKDPSLKIENRTHLIKSLINGLTYSSVDTEFKDRIAKALNKIKVDIK